MAYTTMGEDALVVTTKSFMETHAAEYEKNSYVEPKYYESERIKRGLRNSDGTGVLVGVTKIGNVQGYTMGDDGERIPQEGPLLSRHRHKRPYRRLPYRGSLRL